MKNKIVCALLLLAYCIPWAYFALHGDAMGGTMLMYGIMLLAHASLCVLSILNKHMWIAPVGSALSGAISLLCVKFSSLAEMNYYFKPFTAVHLAALVSLVLFAVQAGAAAWWMKKHKSQHGEKEE